MVPKISVVAMSIGTGNKQSFVDQLKFTKSSNCLSSEKANKWDKNNNKNTMETV